MHIQRQHQLRRADRRPDAQIHGAGAYHPAQIHGEAFARASGLRAGEVLAQPMRRARLAKDGFAESLNRRLHILGIWRKVAGKQALYRFMLP